VMTPFNDGQQSLWHRVWNAWLDGTKGGAV